ncbi:MAG: endonuclease/exonuclease/phosphatase family protein [Oligoflexia bacterium]|nr:endonuclease/exonuclease/phosphatase family protein [Oligoflexia bacterium]
MKTYQALSYNIHKGVPPFGLKSDISKIKQALKTLPIDFLCVQEIVGEKIKSSTKIERQLEELADKYWTHHSYGKNAVFPNRHHGNAILSSYPISESTNINLSQHPLEQRGFLHTVIPIEENNFHLCTTHLDLLPITRNQQYLAILEYLKTLPEEDPLLIVGDFNEVFDEDLEIFKTIGLREQRKPSFPSFFPTFPLDRCLFRHLNIQQIQILEGRPWSQLSDHLPLVVPFQFS